MDSIGIVNGFQWIDGSFLENIEVLENRDPNDLDIVTFHGFLDTHILHNITTSFPEFSSSIQSKTNFLLDHYPVDFTYHPIVTVEATRYWLQLFSHNRKGVWKGIVQLPLNTSSENELALDFLNGLGI
ncbi:hypothetical protein FPZ43_05355 [Mucilaginibacter pallidiroseus]|uniref:Uncharacterized protein n=2 Tax=Mucilaginibacter pallidiroseus TaxID=2599295 RepID=A0A563UGG0_9SPHI|nr:hypothetical protein [Mucilaginibacter pallidiroseus]TWR30369.1 hypothetical protein FPZ43_05355 [Mucilaginibacter pallidiroseus]